MLNRFSESFGLIHNLFVLLSLFVLWGSIGTWKRYNLLGIKSEYYRAVGGILLALGIIGLLFLYYRFPDLSNVNIALFTIIFLLVPFAVNIYGQVLGRIYYKPVLEEYSHAQMSSVKSYLLMTFLFKYPDNFSQIESVTYRKDLVKEGIIGYSLSLLLCILFKPADVLSVTLAVVSEIFLIIAPLVSAKPVHKTKPV